MNNWLDDLCWKSNSSTYHTNRITALRVVAPNFRENTHLRKTAIPRFKIKSVASLKVRRYQNLFFIH